MQNLDDLRSLERKLRKNDEETRDRLVKLYLTTCAYLFWLIFVYQLQRNTVVLTGGHGFRDAVFRSWAKLVSNELASQLNWKGAVRADRPKKVGVERLQFTKEILSKETFNAASFKSSYFPGFNH